jgi:hypothetical protein
MASLWNSQEKLSNLKKQMQVVAIGCAVVTLFMALILTISNHRLDILRSEQIQQVQRQQADIQKSSAESLEQALSRMNQELGMARTQIQAEKAVNENLRNKLAIAQKQMAEAKAEFQRQTTASDGPASQPVPSASPLPAQTSDQPELSNPEKVVDAAVAPPASISLPLEPPFSQINKVVDRKATLKAGEVPESAPPAESSANQP